MAGQKILTHDAAGGFTEVIAPQSGGAPSANKVPSLDGAGLIDVSMLPAGLGSDTASLPAAGALAAGDFVNVFNDAGTPRMRKADASALLTQAHGFVLLSVLDLATGTMYFQGNNTAVSGMTAGNVFLSITAGLASNTAPISATEIVQRIGVAISPTVINFEPQMPVLLA